MKKLALALALVALSFVSYSQTRLTTYKNVTGRWNTYRNDYDMENEYRYAKITFTFYDTYVQADDEARSVYRIVAHHEKQVVPGKEMVSAECLDENNRKCNIILVSSNNKLEDSFVIVQYVDYAYFYAIFKQ